MAEEIISLEVDIEEFKCDSCHELFYTYNRNNICPHCNHMCSEEAMRRPNIITEPIVEVRFKLNTRTGEITVDY